MNVVDPKGENFVQDNDIWHQECRASKMSNISMAIRHTAYASHYMPRRANRAKQSAQGIPKQVPLHMQTNIWKSKQI